MNSMRPNPKWVAIQDPFREEQVLFNAVALDLPSFPNPKLNEIGPEGCIVFSTAFRADGMAIPVGGDFK